MSWLVVNIIIMFCEMSGMGIIMDKQKVYELYKKHKGEIIGAGVGLSIAVIVLLLGVLRALFIVVCVILGYYIGKRLSQDKDYVKNLLDRILPPGTYR